MEKFHSSFTVVIFHMDMLSSVQPKRIDDFLFHAFWEVLIFHENVTCFFHKNIKELLRILIVTLHSNLSFNTLKNIDECGYVHTQTIECFHR